MSITDRTPQARAVLAHKQHMTHNPKICALCEDKR